MAKRELGLVFDCITENCIEQMKTSHVYFVDDAKRGWKSVDSAITNMLIEGENYQALRTLLYTHAGKIDCIYIDPPYGTGNNDFVYNDVFVDEEDTYRHSKWLSFMKNRLEIAHRLLTDEGMIFVSIDENEFAHLKLLLDQIFGEQNMMATIIWDKRNPKGNVNHFACVHEYIFVYAKNKTSIGKLLVKKSNAEMMVAKANELFAKNNLIDANKEFGKWLKTSEFSGGEKHYNKIDESGRVWRSVSLCAPGSGVFYDVIHPITKKPCKTASRGWKVKNETMIDMIRSGQIVFGKDETTVPMRKYYLDEYMFQSPTTIYSSAVNGVDDLPDGIEFSYPKPVSLIKHLIGINGKKNAIILDFFAGSGTTGQAVAEVNREDGGNRQFILITNNDKSDRLPNGIARDCTYPRLEKTIKEYTNLRYLRVETLKHTDKHPSDSAKIAQLQVENRRIL